MRVQPLRLLAALVFLLFVFACRQEPAPDVAVTLPAGPVSLLGQAAPELLAQENMLVADVVFEIHGIERIHQGPDETMRKQAIAAGEEFLREESLERFDFTVDFNGPNSALEAYSPEPIVIRDAERWIRGATERWRNNAESVFGKACSPKVVFEFTD